MKSIKNNMRHLAIVIIITAGMAACNTGTETVTDSDKDSLNRTDNTRTDNTKVDTANNIFVKTDAEWVSEVLENNYAEIKMAQQAQEKATNAEVKSLAQTLEKDHKALVNEAKDLASRKNWTVAAQETADAREKMADMAKDDVKEYEREWLEMMEDKHEKSIRKFENVNADDADLKTWVNNTLPKLRAHLDRINQVQKNRK